MMAFRPTLSMSGGSDAPMENSPPGIQAMPSGVRPGAVSRFGTVGPKLAAAELNRGVSAEADPCHQQRMTPDAAATRTPPIATLSGAPATGRGRVGLTRTGRPMHADALPPENIFDVLPARSAIVFCGTSVPPGIVPWRGT